MDRSDETPGADDKHGLLKNVSGADQLTPLDPGDVTVGGEIGRRIDLTISRNLLALDVDRDFIAPFRRKATTSYVGLGKLIDAAVNFAAYSGDAAILSRKDHLVREAIRAQEADGYIGTMKPADRMAKDYDIHEMTYLVMGLARNYRQYGDRDSLDAATKLANHIIRNWSDANRNLTTQGLEGAFFLLSKVTGDPAYLDFAADTEMGFPIGYSSLRAWRRPVEGHVYRYLSRCMMQLELHRAQPDESLLEQARRALGFLAFGDGLVITGTCSRGEHWHGDQDGSGRLGETCATAYLIRFLDNVIRLEGDLQYGDIMERSIYNALFAAQAPDGRRLRYFTPFEGKRPYFDSDVIDLPSYDTYCCPNNFRRIVAELPSRIYYASDRGLVINLYTSSTATVALAGDVSLTVRQETDYPNSGHVTVYLDPSASTSFAVGLRIPRWCPQGQVAVNGRPVDQAVVGGQLLEITRTWESGDRITLDLPMPWRIIRGRKMQEGRAAVMRGPVVYALGPERNGPLDGVDLSEITIDPLSLGGPTKDDAVRPDGLQCRVRAWSGARDLRESPDLDLLLTEFPEPTGEATYFHVPSIDDAVDDELTLGLAG